MSDLSPLCAPKRTFANVSGLGSRRSEICAMSTNAHSKIGPAKFANKGYVTAHCRTNAFAYAIHDLYGDRGQAGSGVLRPVANVFSYARGCSNEYTNADVRELRTHSKAKTAVVKIAKLTRRSVGSLRQQALKLGIRLGHRR